MARRQVGDKRQLVALKFPTGSSEGLRPDYELLRVCAHPGVLVVSDLLEAGRGLDELPDPWRKYRAAMVMEPALGGDLASPLEAQGPCFDAGLAKDWSRTLASALASLHAKGITR